MLATRTVLTRLGRLGVVVTGLLTLILPVSALGADARPGKIRRLFRNLPGRNVTCGALVVDLQTGRTLFARDEGTPLVPASNQKLLVLATTIATVSADAAFDTLLVRRGDDLLLIADGDPCLGDAKLTEVAGQNPLGFLDRWAASLQAAGLSRIAGDLVVDAAVYDEQYTHPDWEEADLVKWYGAPVSGLALNNNCVELTVWPGAASGSPALWSLQPPSAAIRVVNECTSVRKGKGSAVPVVGRRPGTNELVLRGKVSKRGTLQSIAVMDPNMVAATAIRECLAARGIRIDGATRFDALRQRYEAIPDAVLIDRQRTPFSDVLRRIGVDSQNMCAESLCKRVGYHASLAGGPADAEGSWATGIAFMRTELSRMGCSASDFEIADASGLARSNRATARGFVQVLTAMFEDPRRDAFLGCLAGNVNGGRLGRRLKDVEGEVYAKTGYIRGVRALSGYVRSEDDRWTAFSVIFNGIRGGTSPYNAIHEQLCAILAAPVEGER